MVGLDNSYDCMCDIEILFPPLCNYQLRYVLDSYQLLPVDNWQNPVVRNI